MSEEWVELFPSGIAVENSLGRPVLILKDQAGVDVLPVWMNPIDAGIALADMTKGTGLTPHVVSNRILEAIGLCADSCSFVDLVGHHQYVQISFKPVEQKTISTAPVALLGPMQLRLRADEAMSFCMTSKARFFSTKSYMTRCRALDAELTQLGNGLVEGSPFGAISALEKGTKKPQYMM
ncbi:MAG TPA: hypothetical protein VM432_00775 [Bdellovibrionales bacterium]|jgi:hypothetical protein|nr:hypothetical protein [Bdellovibrionales bacterium]